MAIQKVEWKIRRILVKGFNGPECTMFESPVTDGDTEMLSTVRLASSVVEDRK